MALIVRLIPIALIVILTILLNKDLDKLEEKKANLDQNWFGKIVWFVFGWTFKLREIGYVIRYVSTFIIFWWLLGTAISMMIK